MCIMVFPQLAISLDKQLDYFKEFQALLVGMFGETNSSSILSDGLYIIGAGSSDFLQNYYINPLLRVTNPFDQFSNILLQNFVVFVQNLYGMGAKKIGVVNLPPLGCLPGAITLFGFGSNECVERLNIDAISFNRKLNSTSQRLRRTLSGLNLVVLDIYQPLYDLVTSPAEYGFSEARKGCCGTGLLETSILCNPLSVGTCTNASEYVFWDAFHPSEAANNILATSLISAGSSLIFP
ncbi:Lipase [Parasponia andersonii]|uniref:Lipase n=1 Tax=Parasponia andersonii TaxID=3476 RepID=A0A2P5BX88_PARAD|nr:Lipase [Parasponia andersonii]